MAKRASKTRKKSSARAPKAKGTAQQALERMDALHRSADALHKQSESMHVAAHATRLKVGSVRTAARRPGTATPVKDLPPSGPPEERVEPTKIAGAPSPDDLQIVG